MATDVVVLVGIGFSLIICVFDRARIEKIVCLKFKVQEDESW